MPPNPIPPSRPGVLPEDERDLLKQMVFEQRETNRKLEKIERELLGEEGNRTGGLVFRLSAAETQLKALADRNEEIEARFARAVGWVATVGGGVAVAIVIAIIKVSSSSL